MGSRERFAGARPRFSLHGSNPRARTAPPDSGFGHWGAWIGRLHLPSNPADTSGMRWSRPSLVTAPHHKMGVFCHGVGVCAASGDGRLWSFARRPETRDFALCAWLGGVRGSVCCQWQVRGCSGSCAVHGWRCVVCNAGVPGAACGHAAARLLSEAAMVI